MKLGTLNRWLSLLANVGVLIGILFLSYELSQTNRIAQRDSRLGNMDTTIDFNQMILENPQLTELNIKLQSESQTLSSIEEEQARMVAGIHLARWGRYYVLSSTELIEDRNLAVGISSIGSTIENYPGLKPFLVQSLENLEIEPTTEAAVYAEIWEHLLN